MTEIDTSIPEDEEFSDVIGDIEAERELPRFWTSKSWSEFLFEPVVQGRFTYALSTGWVCWNGTRWVPGDYCQNEMMRAFRDYMHVMLDNFDRKKNALSSDDKDKRKYYASIITRIESWATDTKIQSIIDAFKGSERYTVKEDADATRFNKRREIFVLRDQCIDLDRSFDDALCIRANSPRDLNTNTSRGIALEDWTSSKWNWYLNQAQPDPEMRAFLARIIGSSMYGSVRKQVFYNFIGGGGTGKSTFLQAIKHAFGSYAIKGDSRLIATKGQQNVNDSVKFMLMGKRFVFFDEIEKGAHMDLSAVKELTGGTTMVGREMRENAKEFEFSATMVLASNEVPSFYGGDSGTRRRLIFVSWDNRVSNLVNESDDNWLLNIFASQSEINAIICWAWHGWLDFQKVGLAVPASITQGTEETFEDKDYIRGWIEDCCDLVGASNDTRPIKFLPTLQSVLESVNNYLIKSGKRPVMKETLSADLRSRQAELDIEYKVTTFRDEVTKKVVKVRVCRGLELRTFSAPPVGLGDAGR